MACDEDIRARIAGSTCPSGRNVARAVSALSMIAVLALQAGCARRANVTVSPGSNADTSASGSTSQTTTGPGHSTKRPIAIKWIRDFTPAGGGGGRRETAYVWLVKGDCATTFKVASDLTSDEQSGGPMEEPYRSLYLGAAAACLAAFHRSANLWGTAIDAFQAVKSGGLGCWDREVYDLLAGIVHAHQNDPGATFQRGSTTAPSPCPELLSVTPSHGSRDGGYRITMIGNNLPTTLKIEFGSHSITATLDSSGALTVTVPPATPDETTVDIYPRSRPARGATPSVPFTYDTEPPSSEVPPPTVSSSEVPPPTVSSSEASHSSASESAP
jgi:hypothetical protein